MGEVFSWANPAFLLNRKKLDSEIGLLFLGSSGGWWQARKGYFDT